MRVTAAMRIRRFRHALRTPHVFPRNDALCDFAVFCAKSSLLSCVSPRSAENPEYALNKYGRIDAIDPHNTPPFSSLYYMLIA